MKKINIIKTLLLIVITITAIPTFARNSSIAKANTNASTTIEKFDQAKHKSIEMIDKRIDGLNRLSARIGEVKKISIDQKTAFDSEIKAIILNLTDLKTKISAETSTSSLKVDTKTITEAFRIFSLIEPQIHITASADRELMIADTLDTLLTKLNTRLASSTSLSENTKIKISLIDLIAKITDIRTQANAAIALVSPLKPDNGDKTILASNLKALKDARIKIQAGQKDIVAAQKTVKEIAKAIKEVIKSDIKSNASSTKDIK